MDKKGFTLIEILLYIGISTILIGGIFMISSLLMQSKLKAEAILEVEEQGREISQIISNDIRNSTTIVFPGAQSASDSLVLAGENDISFILDNNNLYRSLNNNDSIVLHNNKVQITNLSFQNLSLPNTSGVITFQFILDYKNSENRIESSYQKSFYSSTSLRP